MEESKTRANCRIPKLLNGQKGVVVGSFRVSRVTTDRTGIFGRKNRPEPRVVGRIEGIYLPVSVLCFEAYSATD